MTEEHHNNNKENNCPPCPECVVQVEGVMTTALLDSGSETSCISEDFFKELLSINKNLATLPVVGGVTVVGATGKSRKVVTQVFITINIDGMSIDVVCLVVNNLIRNLLLGVDWCYHNRVNICFDKGEVSINNQIISDSLIRIGRHKKTEYSTVASSILSYKPQELERSLQVNALASEGQPRCQVDETDGDSIDETTIRDTINRQDLLSLQQKQQLIQLLLEYKDVFSERPGLINCYTHKINVIKESHFFERTWDSRKQRSFPAVRRTLHSIRDCRGKCLRID